MNQLRVVLFFIGLLILLMGGVPLLAETLPVAKNVMDGIPAPGTFLYQAALLILGVVSLSYSIRGGDKKISKKDFGRAMGGR